LNGSTIRLTKSGERISKHGFEEVLLEELESNTNHIPFDRAVAMGGWTDSDTVELTI